MCVPTFRCSQKRPSPSLALFSNERIKSLVPQVPDTAYKLHSRMALRLRNACGCTIPVPRQTQEATTSFLHSGDGATRYRTIDRIRDLFMKPNQAARNKKRRNVSSVVDHHGSAEKVLGVRKGSTVSHNGKNGRQASIELSCPALDIRPVKSKGPGIRLAAGESYHLGPATNAILRGRLRRTRSGANATETAKGKPMMVMRLAGQ